VSSISSIAGYWMEGTLRTLDAVRAGFGSSAADPPPVTPSRIIYEGGKVRLRHYAPDERKHRTPILLVYSLIKRAFILDLYPGRSVIENLTGQGFDVYLIDWIPPTPADTWRGFDAYVNQDIANAVRAIKIHSGAERVSIIGYCFGALLSLVYNALYDETVKNLVALTIPLDFSQRRLPIDHVSKSMSERSAELVAATWGNVPAWMMFSFFNSLAPSHHLLNKFVVAYRSENRPGYLETFRLFEQWLHSDVPMAGKIFLETAALGQRNSLVKGGMQVGGETVDLKRITRPLLNVIGDRDDIVDPNSSVMLPELISSIDKRNLHYPTGHMGAAVSADTHKRLWPQIGAWLAERDN
jgi:poly[(R)-3-hydroxyalkanoate] polymerase subunit PhaC